MTVVLLSNDLAVLSRVEGAARRAGETVRQAASVAQAAGVYAGGDVRLVVVDLSMPSVEIAAVINQLRNEPSSRPRVIAFGPHVHEQRLAEARDAGCDLVVTRGQFFSQLDSLLATDSGG